MSFVSVYDDVAQWARARGIEVREERMDRDKAGWFDGTSVQMNRAYPKEEQLYYLVHTLGSIVRWSLSRPEVQQMFNNLRDAKKTKGARLENAIQAYRAFEIESSEFAVSILKELGHSALISSYSNFMTADLEALTQFHRIGQAPVWRDFFVRWNEEVGCGRPVADFTPKPVPPFSPVRIERQEIVQKQPEAGCSRT
jgi:23S rRNA G2069 N7-methylase RlmK/C1962 C5-methylase RlmI